MNQEILFKTTEQERNIIVMYQTKICNKRNKKVEGLVEYLFVNIHENVEDSYLFKSQLERY
jgi:hypothetical protein